MRLHAPLVLFLVSLALTGCVDEKIVFRDRELFQELPPGAADFVGYTDADDKLVVCGNCHVGEQSEWETTAHSDAWATLQASASAQAFCEGCHTVNQLGNPTEQEGGYAAVQDERYHDVQCESCHGPGLPHIRNPGATQPLAPLAVGVDLTRGCGECHQGAHHPFVDEWAASGHGRVIAYPAGRPACQGCHTGQGALVAFGVNAEYLEKESAEHLPITCGVCHDPHSNDNEGQLRYPITAPDEERNLCMRCHHKRGLPDMEATNRGPHSPEGPLLLGEAGWWPPNMPIEPGGDPIVSTHGTEANPRLCAGCHVNAFAVEDQLTGETVFTTGHFFQAIPCVDASGAPVSTQECGLSERSFASCTQSGCHGTENAARSALISTRADIELRNDELKALLAQVPASAFDPNDGVYTTAEGARFNSQLADMRGSEVHNPFLIRALLIGSIRQVREDYGL